MCFGDEKTGQTDKTSTANPAVSSAATQNLDFAKGLQTSGVTPYTGDRVAPISAQQQSSFNMADSIGASPNIGTAQNYINSSASAPAGSVSPNTISSMMDPYMSKYVSDSLQPQLEAQKQQFDTQNRGADAGATMAGAFGNDSQAALYKSNLTNQQDIARTGLIGQAYNNAFNTAIGAGAQDVSNNLNAQTTNQNLRETQLNRQSAGATGLEGLLGTQSNIANQVNQFGQQQTAQSQAGLNANYEEFLRQQQYPFLTTQMLNQTVGAGAQAMPASTSEVKSAPDNSGLQALGSIAGAALPLMLSDKREKENIKTVGHLADKTPVKSYNYKKDPAKRSQIGLVAQDVEKRDPGAIKTIGGRKHVDYNRATAPSRALEEQFGIAA